MVRIGGSTEKGKHIKEHDYYTATGEFRVDKEGSQTLLNCLMYKMCYYRFGSVYTEQGKIKGPRRMTHSCEIRRAMHAGNVLYASCVYVHVVGTNCKSLVSYPEWIVSSLGKATGYDRVRNAEIGNKVRWMQLTSRCYTELRPPRPWLYPHVFSCLLAFLTPLPNMKIRVERSTNPFFLYSVVLYYGRTDFFH